MLRVTIEILPAGDPHHARKLDVILITNHGAMNEDQAEDPGGQRFYTSRHLQPTAHGTVERSCDTLQHFRRDGRFELIARALEQLHLEAVAPQNDEQV